MQNGDANLQNFEFPSPEMKSKKICFIMFFSVATVKLRKGTEALKLVMGIVWGLNKKK